MGICRELTAVAATRIRGIKKTYTRLHIIGPVVHIDRRTDIVVV
uniref:Uncharacterized protein n=1 Tax=Peronospora matthiolae TaxID=2874970 RepID=A0AAV1T6J2_9STRA